MSSFEISKDLLGIRYTSFDNFQRFIAHTESLEIGHITWPGGALAEDRSDRYGLSYFGLQSPNQDRIDLYELLDHAESIGANVTVPLPTARYSGRLSKLQKDVEKFVDSLKVSILREFSGVLTFEIGSEYYASFRQHLGDRSEYATAYTRVANKMIESLVNKLSERGIDPDAMPFQLSLQMGRGLRDDTIIRENISELSLSVVSSLTHHRFTNSPDQNDDMINSVRESFDSWNDLLSINGYPNPVLNLSAWGASILPRHTAVDQFERLYLEKFGQYYQLASEEIVNRTNVVFEKFWQSGLLIGPRGERVQTDQGLGSVSLGMAQAGHLIDLFSEYAALGVSAAAAYGIDNQHPGSHSTRINGQDYLFVGAKTLELLYESVLGSKAILENSEKKEISIRSFDAPDRTVIFLIADDIGEKNGVLRVSLSLAEFGEYSAIWQTSLTSFTPRNWQEIFDVPSTPGVRNHAEARAFELGVVEDELPKVRNGSINLSFEQDFQVIRITILKDESYLQRVSDWAGTEYFINGALEGSDHSVPSNIRGTNRDDTFVIRNTKDTILEKRKGGDDTAISGVDYNLDRGNWVESLILAGNNDIDGFGNRLDNEIFGNAGDNIIRGFRGDDYLATGADGFDLLFGGHGSDTLRAQGSATALLSGGEGNDTYIIFSKNTTVREYFDAGFDVVRSDVSYSINGYQSFVEELRLIGERNVAGTGNSESNTIRGNSGDNVLRGMSGADKLFGNDGDDRLFGGAGVDVLLGGQGDDTYFLARRADTIIEKDNGGTDGVVSNFSINLENLSVWIENAQLIGVGSGSIHGNDRSNSLIGNSQGNEISGRSGDDQLFGWGGADIISGQKGDDIAFGNSGQDTLLGGHGKDTLSGGSSSDLLRGGYGSDRLYGNSGDDILVGDSGVDWLTGGEGSDTFLFNFGSDLDWIRDYDPISDEIVFRSVGQGGELQVSATSSYFELSFEGSTVRLLGKFNYSEVMDSISFSW